MTMTMTGDNEGAGGGVAPSSEAGLHRSCHAQVPEAWTSNIIVDRVPAWKVGWGTWLHYCELYTEAPTPNWGLVLRCTPNQKLRLTRSFQTKVQMRLCCMYGRQLVVSKIYSSEITALETADADLSSRAGGKLRSTACWFILLPILSLEQSSSVDSKWVLFMILGICGAGSNICQKCLNLDWRHHRHQQELYHLPRLCTFIYLCCEIN